MAKRRRRAKEVGQSASQSGSMSLEERIEALDKLMEKALREGDFEEAKRLAEEQERLLEDLMLME